MVEKWLSIMEKWCYCMHNVILSIFNVAKVLFVASQFDAFYEPGTGVIKNPNQALVKTKVSETFPSILSEMDVFPVSGRWALYSRILGKNPDDAEADYIVKRAYEDCSSICGCGADQDKRLTVLDKSQIETLEEG